MCTRVLWEIAITPTNETTTPTRKQKVPMQWSSFLDNGIMTSTCRPPNHATMWHTPKFPAGNRGAGIEARHTPGNHQFEGSWALHPIVQTLFNPI